MAKKVGAWSSGRVRVFGGFFACQVFVIVVSALLFQLVGGARLHTQALTGPCAVASAALGLVMLQRPGLAATIAAVPRIIVSSTELLEFITILPASRSILLILGHFALWGLFIHCTARIARAGSRIHAGGSLLATRLLERVLLSHWVHVVAFLLLYALSRTTKTFETPASEPVPLQQPLFVAHTYDLCPHTTFFAQTVGAGLKRAGFVQFNESIHKGAPHFVWCNWPLSRIHTHAWLAPLQPLQGVPGQIFGFIPGLWALVNKKDAFALAIQRHWKSRSVDVHPQTYFLPGDRGIVDQVLRGVSMPALWSSHRAGVGKGKAWIMKPVQGGRSEGILLIPPGGGSVPQHVGSQDSYVIQEYIHDPVLVEGRKFTLRLYVLVTHDPETSELEVYIHEHGIAKFAAETFEKSRHDFSSSKAHVVNPYAATAGKRRERRGGKSIEPEVAAPRYVTSLLWPKLQASGYNLYAIQRAVRQSLARALASVRGEVMALLRQRPSGTRMGHLLGVDVDLARDESRSRGIRALVLECNTNPDLGASGDIERKAKQDMAEQMLQILLGGGTTDTQFSRIEDGAEPDSHKVEDDKV